MGLLLQVSWLEQLQSNARRGNTTGFAICALGRETHLKASDTSVETREQQCTAREFNVTRKENKSQEREKQLQRNAQGNCEEGFRLHGKEAELKMMEIQIEQEKKTSRQGQQLFQDLGKQQEARRQEHKVLRQKQKLASDNGLDQREQESKQRVQAEKKRCNQELEQARQKRLMKKNRVRAGNSTDTCKAEEATLQHGCNLRHHQGSEHRTGQDGTPNGSSGEDTEQRLTMAMSPHAQKNQKVKTLIDELHSVIPAREAAASTMTAVQKAAMEMQMTLQQKEKEAEEREYAKNKEYEQTTAETIEQIKARRGLLGT